MGANLEKKEKIVSRTIKFINSSNQEITTINAQILNGQSEFEFLFKIHISLTNRRKKLSMSSSSIKKKTIFVVFQTVPTNCLVDNKTK